MLEKHGWKDKDVDAPTGLILLEGGKTTTRYDTDFEPVFRQESYFHWAFGVSEPDCYAAISLPSGEATIFVPQNSQTYQVVCGRDSSSKDVKAKYGVENVRPLEEMAGFVSSQLERGEDGKDKGRLHLLRGLNTDSGNMATPGTSIRRNLEPCLILNFHQLIIKHLMHLLKYFLLICLKHITMVYRNTPRCVPLNISLNAWRNVGSSKPRYDHLFYILLGHNLSYYLHS